MELDPSLNIIPDRLRRIHLMGICGTGMGALAGMLKMAGYEVTGSDQDIYPPMSDFLTGLSIPVAAGYGEANLIPRPDLVVVGNVIRANNPEALAVAGESLPYVSFPQALAHFFIRDLTSLVVAGTHGKTTTSSLLASLLDSAGAAPGFMIGGIVKDFGRNFNLPGGEYFVVEGDEYDTAFFDKGPKFLHYRPRITVMTSLEFDHADIYADLDAVKSAFARLVAIMPPDGCLVACLDDANIREICEGASCRVTGYGLTGGREWGLADLEVGPASTGFTVLKHGRSWGELQSPLPGRHNAANVLAVCAVLDRLGYGCREISAGLKAFRGIKRRQEVRGEVAGITVIDDFAHHPTAVRETLSALKAAYAGRRLVAVFEPRTNSSRRRIFQHDYASAFDRADAVVVREPAALAGVPGDQRFSSARLALDLRERGVPAASFSDTEGIIDWLLANAKAGDVLAVLSNGGFDNIHSRLLNGLHQRLP